MGKLYSYADEVVIWLDLPDPTTEEFVQIINQGKVPETPTGINSADQFYFEYSTQIIRLTVMFKMMIARPWWQRVWIVQECILPLRDPIFLCGQYAFGWSKLFAALYGVRDKAAHLLLSNRTPHLHPSVTEISQHIQEPETEKLYGLLSANVLGVVRKQFHAVENISLYFSVMPCIGRQATVPHDYIYGFLGLATEEESKTVQVDYTRSEWDTYREFMDRLLSNAGPEDIQFLTIISFKKHANYPSWIPGFSAQRDVTRYTGNSLASSTCFRTLEEVWWSDDGEVLMLQGVILDEIARTHQIGEDVKAWNHELCHMVEFARSTVKHEAEYPPPLVVSAAFDAPTYQLFTANTLSSTLLELGDVQLQQSWDVITGARENETLDFQCQCVMSQILARSRIACCGRKLIATRVGMHGIAVPNVEEGDLIVCFYGFHMPLVLRLRTEFYTIVGGVFMAGLMDWAVLDSRLEDGLLQEATFRLG